MCVGFAHVVIGADKNALEYREEVFCGVAVLVIAKAGELLNQFRVELLVRIKCVIARVIKWNAIKCLIYKVFISFFEAVARAQKLGRLFSA
jgi:hypothetical protein